MEEEQPQKDSNNCMYMNLHFGEEYKVSASLFSMDQHIIKLIEFVDNKFYVNTESLILQLLPENMAEVDLKVVVFMPKDKKETEKLEELFSFLKICYTAGNAHKLKDLASQKSLIEGLLRKDLTFYMKNFAYESALDLAIYTCFLEELISNTSILKTFIIESLDLKKYMRLDYNALSSLDILSKEKEGQAVLTKERDKSIMGILNECKTKMGPRCLRRWVMQPLTKREEIEERLDTVEFLLKNEHFRNYLVQNFLANVPDLDRLSARFYKVKSDKMHNCTLVDVCKVYQVINLMSSLSNFMKDYDYENDRSLIEKQLINPVSLLVSSFDKFKELVEKFVDLNKVQFGEYKIKYEVSDTLRDLEFKLSGVNQDLRTLIEQAERELGTQVTLERDANNTYLMKVHKRVEKTISSNPGLNSKYKSSSVRGNYMKLTTKELKSISYDKTQLETQYQKEQGTITTTILKIVASYYPALEDCSELISQVDTWCAFAVFSKTEFNKTMVRPIFNDGERIVLKKARHPIIDKFSSSGSIPNDCIMDRGRSSFHIITGPNMGGKSTYIRLIGINIFLAQIGCFCCADFAELPIFENIITRVGAGDIQSKGVSTWMSELLEVSCMLDSANPRTFLIIDELGRGTSTSEGVGMTWAIAENIISKLDSFCLFATHFFELTELEQLFPQVKNYHVEAHIQGDQLVMSYEVKKGLINKSYGIGILKMLKFHQKVIRNATIMAEKIEQSQAAEEDLEQIEKQASDLSLDCQVQIIKMFTYYQKKIRETPDAVEKERLKDELLDKIKVTKDYFTQC